MVITHAEHPALGYSVSQQIEAAQMGAWIEHSYNNIWFKRASLDEVYSQICAVGYEHIILSSIWASQTLPTVMKEWRPLQPPCIRRESHLKSCAK